jgi:hypothetical protein
MSAQETARMSVLSAAAIVGSETMKIRVATPEMNCPIIALTSSSASVRWGIRLARASLKTRGGSCDVLETWQSWAGRVYGTARGGGP